MQFIALRCRSMQRGNGSCRSSAMDHNRDRLEDIKAGLSQEQLDIQDAIQSLQDMISEIEKIVFEKEPPRRPRS